MNSFPLKIVTPDGLRFDGRAQQLTVRTTSGDLGILAGHMNTVAPLAMGPAAVVTGEQRRVGVCEGGVLAVMDGEVTLLCRRFRWEDRSQ